MDGQKAAAGDPGAVLDVQRKVARSRNCFGGYFAFSNHLEGGFEDVTLICDIKVVWHPVWIACEEKLHGNLTPRSSVQNPPMKEASKGVVLQAAV